MDQQNQQPQQPAQLAGGVLGPTGRRLHIAHRRSPSELTPLMSMFSSPGMEQLAIQQQIDLLQAQQQQIQATHQQYVNMGMIPPNQQFAQPAAFGQIQQQMPNMATAGFQFPGQMHPQQQMANVMGAPANPLSHRRNQSALPNMSMGPPPAPSSGASGSGFADFQQQVTRESQSSQRGGRGGGVVGAGHQRRHSLALPEAKKAAELAQQKRTTTGFQFPIPNATPTVESNTEASPSSDLPSMSRGRGGHGRSQSVAVGGRGGSSMRGGGNFQFPMATTNENVATSTPERRGSNAGHARNSSRNFEGNWRNNPQPVATSQDQSMGNFGQGQAQATFQPGHRSRGSMSGNNSISSIGGMQYAQPQLLQLPQGIMVQPQLFPGQQLSQQQMLQLQALQQAQLQGQMMNMQGAQGQNQLSSQQQNQQQRKTLFTPYLPQATLPALLNDGQLVSGILRVNKKNRSDAYVSTQDGLLDADIFICGSKDRNRALEGDLVAVELLDVDEVWGQKREKEEKKKRKDVADGRPGNSNGSSERSHHRDNSISNDTGTNESGGLRRRGSLRQRPTQKKNDDVEVEGQSLLLVEEDEVNDEQKPLYAGHIVAVVERVAGQMFSGTLGLLRPSSQATKEKQEAERQARDGSSGRQQEHRQQDKPKIVWFKPTDKRVPLIAIPTEQAPRDFVEKHQDYADRIFVACIKRWPITSLHPFGTLVEQLGKMGELKVETDALLRDNNFASDDFSDAVIRSVGLDDWSVQKEDESVIASRRDFREERTFTVDPNGANELDDALHVKEVDGKIEVGIHITDVAHFIKANSLIDREAKKRGTAVFLMNRSCAMLPPKIAGDVCSLIPGQERLTVSIVLKVNATTGIVAKEDVWIGKSIIKSGGKISYSDVDDVIAGNDDVVLDGCSAKEIRLLQKIAHGFKAARLESDVSNLAPLRLLYQLDDENVPVEHNIFNSRPSHELVEELMHKANHYVAEKILAGLPEAALLRRQGPPNARRLQKFVERMYKIGYELDTTNSGTLQNSLLKIDDAEIRKGMETLLVKTMQRGKYYVAGRTPAHLQSHYALNLPVYTHFTNPSRRYADLVVHRQLEFVLANGAIEYNEDVEALAKTTEACNIKKDSAQNAQEQSVHIESCRIMDKEAEDLGEDLISEGIVLCVYESAFDVLIPEYGFEKRVHCDQLPLKKAEFRKEKRVLELYWEKDVPSSGFIPEDERPKAGMSQRQNTNPSQAAREAAVAERARKDREEASHAGAMSAEEEAALFDEEEKGSSLAIATAGVSLADRPTQSGPPSPTKRLQAKDNLRRSRSESKVLADNSNGKPQTTKEKYHHLFKLREEGGEYIQDVVEMQRIPVILKTDLSKSPPCLTIRSLNPYAL